MITTSKRLEGVGEYYFSGKLREIELLKRQGKDIINLGIGSPDLPAHPDVIKVLREESLKPDSHGYQPYKGSPVFRQAISTWYNRWFNVKLDADTEILPLMGSKEGIMHICMTYLNEGDKVLVPDPGYPTYAATVKLAGAGCIHYSLNENNNYYPDLQLLEQADLSAVRLMFVNYPNMPSGKKGSMELFGRIIQFAAERDILVVHDNPYSFILNDKPVSMLSSGNSRMNVIELNSLSKSHNMAGWRVGMLCGAKERIDEVLRFKSNMDSGMFLPVQLAAAKALSLGSEWHDELNKIYRQRQNVVFDLLSSIKCSYTREQAGLFVWAGVPPEYDNGFDFSDEILKKHSVFITPGGIFGNEGKRFVRISLCSPVERIEEAVQRIKK